MTKVDTEHAVEIADRIWWVGHYLPGDVFQCHVYLIENGDQSVLIDPGSVLTFPNTLKKIEEVTPFSNIRYFICHHQDPDITGAMGLIDQMVCRQDALLVTHWRAAALLKHYALRHLPFWQVEEHDWKLRIDGRILRFIFTPYLHFPGAFTTFDESTGVLFSSDIFGGFTEEWQLFAKDESYFEAIRSFHEHYMPSRDILQHGLSRMKKYPIRMIAPQHGSIIPESLVDFMFERLEGLDCGLYLMVEQDTDIKRLMAMNHMLRHTLEAMMLYRDFPDIVHHLLDATQQLLPVKALEFLVREGEKFLLFGPANHYHGEALEPEQEMLDVFAHDRKSWMMTVGANYRGGNVTPEGQGQERLIVPLFPADGACRAITIMHLETGIEISREMDGLLGRMSEPLLTAVEREMLYRGLEDERNAIYERSIRDPLTGLFTRHYMMDVVVRMLELHNREANTPLSLVMLDVDFFKRVNDAYGHIMGDEVLKKTGDLLLQESRPADVPVRFGGEEFAVFLTSKLPQRGMAFAERVCRQVRQLHFRTKGRKFSITISAGIAEHRHGESLQELIHRADLALYRAKQSGRDQVCMAMEQHEDQPLPPPASTP